MNTALRYLELKREIEIREMELEAVAAILKESGPARYETERGAVTIAAVNGRKTTDWKAPAATCKIPAATIEKFTKVGEASLRITTGAV